MTGWQDDAACIGTDPDAFFPEADESRTERFIAAKRLCGACPVKVDCLTYAIEAGEQHGVWGGLTPTERRRLRRAAA